MKTFLRLLLVVGLVASVFQLAPAAFASCVDPTPFQHFIGGYLKGVDEGTVSVRAFVFGHDSGQGQSLPTINSGTLGKDEILCLGDGLDPSAKFCQPEATGAGNVTISGDWQRDGFVGCPRGLVFPAELQNGDSPIVIFLTTTAGAETKFAILTVGYSFDLADYVFDLAHELNGSTVVPIDLGVPGIASIPNPTISSISPTPNPDGTVNATIGWFLPTMPNTLLTVTYDDWNYALSPVFPTCPAGSLRPRLDGYNIYRRDGPCSTAPDRNTVN